MMIYGSFQSDFPNRKSSSALDENSSRTLADLATLYPEHIEVEPLFKAKTGLTVGKFSRNAGFKRQ